MLVTSVTSSGTQLNHDVIQGTILQCFECNSKYSNLDQSHFKAIQNFTKKPHSVRVILVGVETSFEEKADGLQVVSLKLLSVGEQVSEDDCDVHVRLPVLHAVVHLALGRDHADKVALVSVDLEGVIFNG